MKRCYTKIEPELLDIMKKRQEVDTQFFLAHGYLSEEQMDAADIPRDPGPYWTRSRSRATQSSTRYPYQSR